MKNEHKYMSLNRSLIFNSDVYIPYTNILINVTLNVNISIVNY